MSMNGELVHFVLSDGPEHSHGECRPALVVNDFGSIGDNHMLNLIVFRDGDNDRRLIEEGHNGSPNVFDRSLMEWRTSINHAHPKEFGTWHRAKECGANKGENA